MTSSPRIKLIVIHGWGGSYLEAADRVVDLLNVESHWHNGYFLVPRRRAGMLRHLLNEPADDPYITALRKLAVSRFMLSPRAPPEVAGDADAFSRFSEERLRADFPRFGIPISPDARWRRAHQLKAEAQTQLAPVLDVLRALQQAMKDTDQPRTEAAARERLEALSAHAGIGSLLPLLENLREMEETGGDLDTVGSAVMYAHHFTCAARRAGHPFRYGHEYRFVFLNYHETLRGLAAFAPADLYAADLPVGAFPELEGDIRFLHENDVHTLRFEDHHPYLPERRASLQALIDDEILGFLALSGPEQGTEQREADQRCAAEMVYENLIENTADDCPAARRLREAAHGEDFVRGRTPLGILLTDLIKGGINKVELGQILLDAMEQDDAMERLQARGWAGLPDAWKDDIAETAERLREHAYLLKLADQTTTILSALAAHADPGKPKLPTGKAIEFFAENYPEAHYVFYCWGSSLMVARRLNHADTTLNLGSLMPAIGSPGDGGHAGAAVCRPEANPRYPQRLLGRVGGAEFGRFNQYLASRLTEQGHPVASVENISVLPASSMNRGHKRLAIVLAAAVLLGIFLVAAVPSYRPAHVRESNADFFPHIEAGTELEEEQEDMRESLL